MPAKNTFLRSFRNSEDPYKDLNNSDVLLEVLIQTVYVIKLTLWTMIGWLEMNL
jgi:hypothetical protein